MDPGIGSLFRWRLQTVCPIVSWTKLLNSFTQSIPTIFGKLWADVANLHMQQADHPNYQPIKSILLELTMTDPTKIELV